MISIIIILEIGKSIHNRFLINKQENLYPFLPHIFTFDRAGTDTGKDIFSLPANKLHKFGF